jgi:hypothetical protein
LLLMDAMVEDEVIAPKREHKTRIQLKGWNEFSCQVSSLLKVTVEKLPVV